MADPTDDTRDAARVREADSEATDAQDSTEAPGASFVDEGAQDVAQTGVLTKKKTTEAQTLAFLAAVQSGFSAREAAAECGINLRTAYGLLSRYEADVDALQAATRKIMAMEALDRVDDWRVAAAVGASKRGNHLPAKDWLLHAGIIEPLQGENQAGIRIAINIGTDEKPMRIVSPLREIEGG